MSKIKDIFEKYGNILQSTIMRERKTPRQRQRERWLKEGREDTKALSPEENIRVGTEIVQVALHNGFFNMKINSI